MDFLQRLLTVIVILVMLLIGVLFSIQNTALVPLDLLIVSLPERSVALWVLLAFSLGAVVGMLASSGIILKLRKDLFSLRGQAQKSQREADKLRASQVAAE